MTTFSAYFLSHKRLSEVLSPSCFPGIAEPGTTGAHPTDQMQVLRLLVSVEKCVEQWLVERSFPTLGQLLLGGEAVVGAFFTHFGTFYGRGVADATRLFREGRAPKSVPVLYTRAGTLPGGACVSMQAHPENYTTVSAAGELSGQRLLFAVGRIVGVEAGQLAAQAYAIGQFHNEPRQPSVEGDAFGRLQYRMEVFPHLIEEFRSAMEAPAFRAEELEGLKSIPEHDIKTAFAEILGEPFVPKDWGGEECDLLSTQVHIEGQQLATAFLFKGPAKFRPLTVAHLGVNGDQLSRLFKTPTDLVIVQHCHQITPAVREHCRAFATQIGRLKPFCLIDGADTLRILKAHGKCGL